MGARLVSGGVALVPHVWGKGGLRRAPLPPSATRVHFLAWYYLKLARYRDVLLRTPPEHHLFPQIGNWSVPVGTFTLELHSHPRAGFRNPLAPME